MTVLLARVHLESSLPEGVGGRIMVGVDAQATPDLSRPGCAETLEPSYEELEAIMGLDFDANRGA